VEKSVRQSDQQVRCSSRVKPNKGTNEKKSRFGVWLDHATGSLALASRDANVDAPRRHLGVFLLAKGEVSGFVFGFLLGPSLLGGFAA
jgi:hypothetical protein